MKNAKKTKKRGMSQGAKWFFTVLLLIIAVITVIFCVKSGNFSFKPGSVQAHDDPVTESKAPKDDDGKADSSLTHKVLITAGNGGSSDPAGSVEVDDWGSVTINFIPNSGYRVQSVKVDGEDKGAVDSYKLSYVKDDHTVVATFERIPEPTPTPDPDDIEAQVAALLGE